ncbi:dihydrofolate reductase family protein [Mycetocola saprophilus]|uniref:dihydrofolate reductase family protein n=1 Tax=Mycetocola saprophilus TaxID=76636 RepID=UPI003BF1DDA8
MTVQTETSARTFTGRVFIAASIDGFIARPDGDISWLEEVTPAAEHGPAHSDEGAITDYDAFMASVDSLVMGRATYEKVLTFGFWPYPDHRVIVLSSTLTTDDPNVTVARDLDEALALLATAGSRGVYVDGGGVIRSFLNRDLIDEITITRIPVILGSGLPLFGTGLPEARLEHRGTAVAENGFVTSSYRVLR